MICLSMPYSRSRVVVLTVVMTLRTSLTLLPMTSTTCTMIIVHACTMIIVHISTCMYYDHKQMHNPVNNPLVGMSYKMIRPSQRMPSCNPVFVSQHDGKRLSSARSAINCTSTTKSAITVSPYSALTLTLMRKNYFRKNIASNKHVPNCRRN